MKKTFTRIICMTMLLALSVSLFASCGKKYDTIYYKDDSGDTVSGFNENMFYFHMALDKTSYLYSLGSMQDFPEIWDINYGDYIRQSGAVPTKEQDSKTLGDIMMEQSVASAKNMVAAEAIYEATKGTETVAGKLLDASDAKLEAQVDNTVSQLQLAIGSKEEFEDYIESFGISLEDFRKYYEMSHKMTELKKTVDVSEEEKQEYFSENYVIVKHFIINTVSKQKEDGTSISLTAEEKQEKLAEVEAVMLRIQNGEADEFEKLMETAPYAGSDPGMAVYTEGYFVTKNSPYVKEFREAALEMKEGEVRAVETSYGTHIMKKYPMNKELYNKYSDVNSELASAVGNRKFVALLRPYLEKVVIDEEAVEKYKFRDVPIFTLPN